MLVIVFTGAGPYYNSVYRNPAIPYATVCPSNSTLGGGVCTCNAPTYVQSGNACISLQVQQNTECKALADGLNLLGAPMVHFGSVGLTACFGGYVIKGSGGAGGGGQSELYGPFACSGQNASACSVVPKPSDITATCAPGSYPGTVNGAQVCIPPSSTVDAPKTTTATPPTPGASAPTIPGAPTGTTEQTTQTTCSNGSCTTTTSNKDASGASTGTTTKTESQASYCAMNPKAPGCDKVADASTFSGDCAAGFTFKGDAIQGAIAKEVHRQNCLMNAPNEESALYDTEKVKTGNRTLNLPGNDTLSISSANFDQSNALSAGPACIGNKSVTVMGATVSLPFSTICPWLENLGLVLMAISALLSARIVTRG
ncbi:virulence factor TspB C-terminal domain-related protein [Polaromonas sp.]|uniref:virulence factor TspB C-terminal domain-related protein n=1 Tax=Polaromonas sp. TaxID=1869339 RepID=UPI00326340B9